jgi:hypothetical protein
MTSAPCTRRARLAWRLLQTDRPAGEARATIISDYFLLVISSEIEENMHYFSSNEI